MAKILIIKRQENIAFKVNLMIYNIVLLLIFTKSLTSTKIFIIGDYIIMYVCRLIILSKLEAVWILEIINICL